jgi:hypothetical protein
VQGGNQFHDPIDEQVNNTRSPSHADLGQSVQVAITPQSLPCPPPVPPPSTTCLELVPPVISPAITANSGNIITHRKLLETKATYQPDSSKQPLLTFHSPDKPFIDQSLPYNSQPITSYTLSPTINDSLKLIPPHKFSFNASVGPSPSLPNNPMTRPAKNKNTNLKYTRTGLTRTGPKLDPSRPKNDPNQQLPESMETQTEKKEEA